MLIIGYLVDNLYYNIFIDIFLVCSILREFDGSGYY